MEEKINNLTLEEKFMETACMFMMDMYANIGYNFEKDQIFEPMLEILDELRERGEL